MNHDIIHGILSGLIGPIASKWASRFKCRLIFLVTVVGLYLSALMGLVYVHGWRIGFKLFMNRTTNFAGILVPMALGLLAVFIVFISSIGEQRKKE
ncbi:hypothetical protein [Paraburkholderia adhaesiva]|uniref:hypothetical protein n=1 Tax=Paraburkholderia adhaesiva TaxID=2883244 RepID=UPI001F2BDC78|nr:hypothetical protein [Paraburkholderia adhaesiva]